jgi:hypothetical protein
MASTTKSSGAEANSGSGTNWSSMSNVRSSDDSRSAVSWSADGTKFSKHIKCTSFGFGVSGTIDGIKAHLENNRSASLANVKWEDVKIVKGGTIGATDRSDGAELSGSDTVKVFGSETDLWGESWTDSDINASGFGIAIKLKYVGGDPIMSSGTGRLDHVQLEVFYTAGGGGIARGVAGAAGIPSSGGVGVANAPLRMAEARGLEFWRPSTRRVFIFGSAAVRRRVNGWFWIPTGGWKRVLTGIGRAAPM